MKKSIIIFIISILAFSCSDFLQESDPNRIELPDYFQNENDVLRAVNSIYLAIRSGNCLGEGSTAYTEERSDNMGRTDNQSNAGEPFQFTDFSLLPSNAYLMTHWSALFTAITRCNFVLTYIDDVKFEDNANREMYRAEALFVRALIYLHAVRKWGDLPLITTYLMTPDEVAAKTFREKKEKVYEQIVNDLTESLKADKLPVIQPTAGKGRACKAAINALLGEAYLTMATTLADNRQANLAQAKKYLTDAYNMRRFGQLKDISYEDVFDVSKKNTCEEIIFQIQYIQGNINYSSSNARSNQPRGETICSLFPSNGTGTYINLDIVKEYEDNDLRKDFSVRYSPNAGSTWYITKFRDASAAAGVNGYGGNDWILLRFAHVILMLAEVHMYLGENDDAIGYLNQARERAGLPNYADMQSDADYTSKYPTLKLAILHERRVELAFENHRWFDLLRFFTPQELQTYIQAKVQTDYGISNVKNFGLKDIYYPIPFDETKLNPEKMYQNEGY
jgi:hypothetical protein